MDNPSASPTPGSEPTPVPLYKVLASTLEAIANCRKSDNMEWEEKHAQRLEKLCAEHLPSGSGLDNGSHLDLAKSNSEKLVIAASFHHMDEHGFYDGWTRHTITVKASLAHGIQVSVSGADRNDIKEYLHETFRCVMESLL